MLGFNLCWSISKVRDKYRGKERKPAGVTSANIRGRLHTQLRRRNASIPAPSSELEISKLGALGKRSTSHVPMENDARNGGARSGKYRSRLKSSATSEKSCETDP